MGTLSMGTLSLRESEIVDNVAKAALAYPCSGAIYAISSTLVLAMSKVNRDVVDGGGFGPYGGAVYLSDSAAQIARGLRAS